MNEPQLPLDDEAYRADMVDLVKRCNGAVYLGDRAEAVIRTIIELREDPNLAQRLLEHA